MLDRLEAASSAQRQFLDDAGHELKTPLTILRGHLELLDADDPTEVAETRELLLDEVDRMSRLVGDLILLAKSGRPDFLVPQPVSLERLTETVLAKARGLGDRDLAARRVAGETIVATTSSGSPRPCCAGRQRRQAHRPGDGSRSARRTTAAGAVLGAGHRCRRPDEDKSRIFERFGRAVPSRRRGVRARSVIVQAIADAHGGTVTSRTPSPAPGSCSRCR